MRKHAVIDFIFAANTDGNGNAVSPVRALANGKGLAEIANQWRDDAE